MSILKGILNIEKNTANKKNINGKNSPSPQKRFVIFQPIKRLGFIIFISAFISCGHEKGSFDWITTTEGVKIFIDDSVSNLFFDAKYSWQGNTLNGLAHGSGTLTATLNDKTEYTKKLQAFYGNMDEGYIKQLKKEGQGYFGEEEESQPQGFGIQIALPKIYIGNFDKGQGEGEVSVFQNDTLYYRGEWKKGKYSGIGKLYYPNKEIRYEGEWKNSLPDGKGTAYYPNGNIKYAENWEKGKYDGKGKLYYPDGKIRYEGEWKNSLPDGEGTAYYSDGKIKYEGAWKNGEYDNKGTLYYPEGNIQYKGQWKNSLPEGKGTAYNPDGTVKYKGKWENGKQCEPNKQNESSNGNMILIIGGCCLIILIAIIIVTRKKKRKQSNIPPAKAKPQEEDAAQPMDETGQEESAPNEEENMPQQETDIPEKPLTSAERDMDERKKVFARQKFEAFQKSKKS